MISFNCQNCGSHFELDDGYAGVRAACTVCNARFIVPVAGRVETEQASASFQAQHATPQAQSGGKLSPRQRRLNSDYKIMQDRFTTFPLIHLEKTFGNPPERYIVSYHIRGIERVTDGRVVYRDYHEVEITLPGTYPRTPPICKMLTPVFHPNIEPAIICIGDHWTAQERLSDLVIRIAEMIAYQAHNIKSPLDGEAAMWTDLHNDMLPVDSRDMTPPDPAN